MSFIKKIICRAMHCQLSKFDELYQRHTGEECYIFGDGISLKWLDMHQFSDRISILGGMMIYHKDLEALNAPYCAIIEPYFFYSMFPTRCRGKLQLFGHSLQKEYKKSIANNPETQFFLNATNFPVARFSNTCFVSPEYKPHFENKNPFKENVTSHHGTFRFQVALAIFLGFKKAYLVGHDYTHFPSRGLHFYEKGNGENELLLEKRGFSLDFIEYAKKHIDLVTVTLDACGEAMDSIRYQELTGKEPNFRENNEIVDRVKLNNLATWAGYSIY